MLLLPPSEVHQTAVRFPSSNVLHICFIILELVSLEARVAREGDEKCVTSQYSLLMILV